MQPPAVPAIKQPSPILTHALLDRRRNVGLQFKQVSLKPNN